jgi:hypothetical protein
MEKYLISCNKYLFFQYIARSTGARATGFSDTGPIRRVSQWAGGNSPYLWGLMWKT